MDARDTLPSIATEECLFSTGATFSEDSKASRQKRKYRSEIVHGITFPPIDGSKNLEISSHPPVKPSYTNNAIRPLSSVKVDLLKTPLGTSTPPHNQNANSEVSVLNKEGDECSKYPSVSNSSYSSSHSSIKHVKEILVLKLQSLHMKAQTILVKSHGFQPSEAKRRLYSLASPLGNSTSVLENLVSTALNPEAVLSRSHGLDEAAPDCHEPWEVPGLWEDWLEELVGAVRVQGGEGNGSAWAMQQLLASDLDVRAVSSLQSPGKAGVQNLECEGKNLSPGGNLGRKVQLKEEAERGDVEEGADRAEGGEGDDGGEMAKEAAADSLNEAFFLRFQTLQRQHNVCVENCAALQQQIQALEKRNGQMEKKVKEATEWAHKKVMEAALKLRQDSAELKSLREEKEDWEEARCEREAEDERRGKKAAELEAAFRKACGRADAANSAVRRLEMENAELRAEAGAANLRANEIAGKLSEITKKEGKAQKKVQIVEKQKQKLQEELSEGRQKLQKLSQQLSQAVDREQQVEIRCRQEQNAKQEAIEKADCEKRLREHAEAEVKKREDLLRKKSEEDNRRSLQRIQRLEREIAQLRLTDGASDSGQQVGAVDVIPDKSFDKIPTSACASASQELANEMHARNVKLLRELSFMQEPSNIRPDKECVMCMSEEISVVFLPCAHFVVCDSCNKEHKRQGMRDCPSCCTPIQQRVRVFGAT